MTTNVLRLPYLRCFSAALAYCALFHYPTAPWAMVERTTITRIQRTILYEKYGVEECVGFLQIKAYYCEICNISKRNFTH